MGIVFGPVPSRRLGMSLGINNIPDKVCSYACVYCQIGRTLSMEIERREFYDPEAIAEEVERHVGSVNGRIDYVTFVPDGEPTLDANLGRAAELLRDLGYRLAILTNSSLLWREDVREDLSLFDYVSLKLDAVSEGIWRKIDRPHKGLKLERILDGMLELRGDFGGKLVTETMLINIDYGDELRRIADFLADLKPDVAYIGIPTRPPAEGWVRPADESTLNEAYNLFSRAVRTEYLIGYEGNAFASTGNFEEDVLSITAVHPMRRDAVEELMRRDGADWEDVERLIREGKLVRVTYEGETFYMRKLKSRERR
ncbi:MAG: radical SAM protein [Thermococci archaeon]|nr:radical SAM protein [Thermococci archaeon]